MDIATGAQVGRPAVWRQTPRWPGHISRGDSARHRARDAPPRRLGFGKLYHRTGKREQAHEHLATATTMYREMGMTYWLEQAEAELKE